MWVPGDRMHAWCACGCMGFSCPEDREKQSLLPCLFTDLLGLSAATVHGRIAAGLHIGFIARVHFLLLLHWMSSPSAIASSILHLALFHSTLHKTDMVCMLWVVSFKEKMCMYYYFNSFQSHVLPRAELQCISLNDTYRWTVDIAVRSRNPLPLGWVTLTPHPRG